MNQSVTYRSKSGRISLSFKTHTVAVVAVLAVVLTAAGVLSMSLGGDWTSPADVLKTLLGYGTQEQWLVIGVLRLPRILVSVLVGSALAVSGSILQGLVRNPLASPDIIGITQGASLAAVAFITFFTGAVSIHWLPVAAFLGAGLVSLLIYFLAWNRGVTPTRLVLIGIGISAVLGALTTLMIVISPIRSAGQAFIWLMGSIYGASWHHVYALLPWVMVFIPLAIAMSRNVTVQELGDDVARGLGSPVQLHRFALLLVSVVLAGSAVSIAGAIGFVGLIAPHIARKLVGSAFGSLIPVAVLTGGLIVLMADTVGRTVFLPRDIPAGVFTAGIGAPFFIYLLYRNRNQ